LTKKQSRNGSSINLVDKKRDFKQTKARRSSGRNHRGEEVKTTIAPQNPSKTGEQKEEYKTHGKTKPTRGRVTVVQGEVCYRGKAIHNLEPVCAPWALKNVPRGTKGKRKKTSQSLSST